MQWSYDDLLSTPVPVVDEIISWMKEIHDETMREMEKQRRKR